MVEELVPAAVRPWWERAVDGELSEADLVALGLDDWDERDADPGYRGPLHDLLARLAASAPEPETAEVLAGIDPVTLDDEQRLLWLRAVDRCASWVASLTDRGLLAAAGPRVRQDPAGFDAQGRRLLLDDVAREEVALALRWSPAHAHARITTARRLASLLPATAAALAAGDVDPLRARILADHAGRLLAGLPAAADPTSPAPDPQQVAVARALAGRLEDRVLPAARTRTPGRVRAACERAVTALDPAGATRRIEQARRGRDCRLTPLPDGQALWWARLDAATALACQRRVDQTADTMRRRWASEAHASAAAAARRAPTIGEWRAEALAALLLHDPRPDTPPTTTGTRRRRTRLTRRDRRDRAQTPLPGAGDRLLPARVEVVIDLPTLLGLADNPTELLGYGPLPAAAARSLIALADDVDWQRLVTDPLTGHLLDAGRRTYRIPDPLRRHIQRRDPTCRFPGCARPAAATGVDVDHAVPWHTGGSTDRSNLGPLCRRHHLLKTHASWRLSGSRDDGTCVWTSPHGLHHHHEPVPVLEPAALRESSHPQTPPPEEQPDPPF